MTRRRLFLDDWDWYVLVYLGTDKSDAEDILQTLQEFACSNKYLRQAENNLSSGRPNQGLTYTNVDERVSVMVVGRASSASQFYDTLAHEMGHVASHISEAEGIDCRGEEQQYILGEIARQMAVLI